MKARWFFLLLGLTLSSALLTINAAGAKPPKSPLPGTGTPAIVTVGTPGTITMTHYTPDGRTVLGTERVRASASDTSATVAARLGLSAPAAVKTGVVSDWDDLGRPDALVAQVESPAGASRTTTSTKRVVSKSDCCSNSGCDAVEVTRDINGDIFGSWSPLGTFHHRVYWCWSNPRITGVTVSCWSTVDGSFVSDNGCNGWGNYYNWRGNAHGGHVSFRSGDWGNCVFWIACFGNIYPWIEIWVNGNGAWAQDQGG